MVTPIFLFRTLLFLPLVVLGLLLSAAPAAVAQQPGSVLLWPVNPVIEANARAAALWLENPGRAPVTLQVRIFAWAQTGGRNVYAPQTHIFGTPPIVTIQPGGKQLVRLTRTGPPPAVGEDAYRIVVDEIPTRETTAAAGAAVSFRMRYLLPLFVRGADVSGVAARAAAARPAPLLGWRIISDDGGRHLEIRNSGIVHARLVGAAFTGNDGGRIPIAPGLLGYVLPRSTARWPLANGTQPSGNLVASVNGAEEVIVAPLVE